MLKAAAQSLSFSKPLHLSGSRSLHAISKCSRSQVWSNVHALPRPCMRGLSTSLARRLDSSHSSPNNAGDGSSAGSSSLTPPKDTIKLDPLEPRLSITFTCTAEECHERSTHTFTKRSYERGIVIVQCPGCKNRHLIADHLGWFKESTEEGKLRTVEDLLRARGEKVRRGRLDAGGVVEYSE